eukprot:5525545-Alexandrium_andersonii.AAC.1
MVRTEAEEAAKEAAAGEASERRQTWHEWVKEVVGGGVGKAYRFIREAPEDPEVNAAFAEDGALIVGAEALVE